MRRFQTKQSFRLRVLALVLAVAISWYSINPAPGPISRHKPEEAPPDEKRRELKPRRHRADVLSAAYVMPGEPFLNAADDEPDDFEWPDIIDA